MASPAPFPMAATTPVPRTPVSEVFVGLEQDLAAALLAALQAASSSLAAACTAVVVERLAEAVLQTQTAPLAHAHAPQSGHPAQAAASPVQAQSQAQATNTQASPVRRRRQPVRGAVGGGCRQGRRTGGVPVLSSVASAQPTVGSAPAVQPTVGLQPAALATATALPHSMDTIIAPNVATRAVNQVDGIVALVTPVTSSSRTYTHFLIQRAVEEDVRTENHDQTSGFGYSGTQGDLPQSTSSVDSGCSHRVSSSSVVQRHVQRLIERAADHDAGASSSTLASTAQSVSLESVSRYTSSLIERVVAVPAHRSSPVRGYMQSLIQRALEHDDPTVATDACSRNQSPVLQAAQISGYTQLLIRRAVESEHVDAESATSTGSPALANCHTHSDLAARYTQSLVQRAAASDVSLGSRSASRASAESAAVASRYTHSLVARVATSPERTTQTPAPNVTITRSSRDDFQQSVSRYTQHLVGRAAQQSAPPPVHESSHSFLTSSQAPIDAAVPTNLRVNMAGE